jgi:aspartyl-tRNA(Asn)/glutamyl-tRNA(Gln) amidotransferase subunit B
MNSFSGARRALEYEIPRQIGVVTKGGKLVQSTRRWDDVTEITEEMRTKEHAHDYRYFAEPDLMPFAPSEQWLSEVRARVVELPLARKQRFIATYQLPPQDAQTFVDDVPLGDYFESIAKKSKNPKAVANWVINNLRAKIAEANSAAAPGGAENVPRMTLADLKFQPDGLLELVALVENKTISTAAAQQVFSEMFETGKSPGVIVQEKGLAQVSDTAPLKNSAMKPLPRIPGQPRTSKRAKPPR